MNIDPYIAEFIGTFILLLLGQGRCSKCKFKKNNCSRPNSMGLNYYRMGFSVFVAVFITAQFSGGHLNPAVTIGLALAEKFSWAHVPGYLIAQLLGAMFGSWTCYITYIDHHRATIDEAAVRSTFCTVPAIRNFKNNFFQRTDRDLCFGFWRIVYCHSKYSDRGC